MLATYALARTRPFQASNYLATMGLEYESVSILINASFGRTISSTHFVRS